MACKKTLLTSLFVVLSCLMFFPAYANATSLRLYVSDQLQMDNLNEAICNAAEKGISHITVEFSEGQYYFKQNNFRFYGKKWPGLSLDFIGNNTRLSASGQMFADGCRFSFESFPTDCVWISDGKEVDIASPYMQTTRPIRVLDAQKKICSITKSPKDVYRADASSKIILTQSYWSKAYNVLSDNGKEIIFLVDDLRYQDDINGYTCNLDLLWGKQMPRYSLLNADGCKLRVKNGIVHLTGMKTIHCCTASTCIYFPGTVLRQLTVKGITFIGNGGKQGLMFFENSRIGKIRIEKCCFESIRNFVINCYDCPNLTFQSNKLRNIYNYGIFSSNQSANTIVTNNEFRSCCKSLDFNTAICVRVCGENFRVADNLFENCGICSVAAGKWFGEKQPCSGIIENNLIYYTSEVLSDIVNHCSYDNGAIYTLPVNDDVHIRYNYIHDIDGMGLNRGIFCDDGTGHVNVYGNMILRIRNSMCIDLRRDNTHDDVNPDANKNNRIEKNFIDGSMCFEGRSIGDGNVRGKNYLLNSGKDVQRVIKTNMWTAGSDVALNNCKYDGDKIFVPYSYAQKIDPKILNKMTGRYIFFVNK